MDSKRQLTPIDQVSSSELAELTSQLKDFSLCHGNMMKIHTNPVTEGFKGHSSSTTLVPSVFPQDQYEFSLQLQPLYNKLYRRIAYDQQFLEKSLASVIEGGDEFIKKHVEIMRQVRSRSSLQKYENAVTLGLVRSDYMLHEPEGCIKQVEMNTMSAAASGVNRAATTWHRYVSGVLLRGDSSLIPDNGATRMLAGALVKANDLYSETKSAILFVVGESEFNFADQRWLQYDIHEIDPRVKVIRATFEELLEEMKVDENGKLFIDNDEIGVVYFRYGYSPTHYTHKEFWDLRLKIEQTSAVKCPDVSHYLAGSKRIQQLLTEPGVLEKFLDNDREVSMIRKTFVKLHSLHKDEDGSEHVELALDNPSHYILKPQRDGGGNNFTDSDMVEKLQSLDEHERSTFTLMEKISPPVHENYLVSRQLIPEKNEVISELGIFGAMVTMGKDEIINEGAGFLLRTKTTAQSEGDLMRGTSSIDSPWLV